MDPSTQTLGAPWFPEPSFGAVPSTGLELRGTARFVPAEVQVTAHKSVPGTAGNQRVGTTGTGPPPKGGNRSRFRSGAPWIAPMEGLRS